MPTTRTSRTKPTKLTLQQVWKDIKKDGPPNNIEVRDSVIEAAILTGKRKNFTAKWGESIPTEAAIDGIRKFVDKDQILMIESKKALWASIIQRRARLTVCPVDNFPRKEVYTPVKSYTITDACEMHANCNALMVVWPDPKSGDIVSALKKFKGKKFIFVGTFQTFGDKHEFFDILEKNWEAKGYINLPQWPGVKDSVIMYTKIN